MTNILHTLINVGNIFDEYETVQEAYVDLGKEEFFCRIYRCAKKELESCLGDEVYVVLDFDSCGTETRIAGFLNPEPLKEDAQRWNQILLASLCENLNKLEQLMQQWGLNSLSELFIELEQGRCENGFAYETIRYELWESMCNLDNHFSYTSYKAVLEQTDCGYEHTIKIPDSTLENVLKHPEAYVLLDVCYE